MADKKYIFNNRLILERWDYEENSALGLELESLTEGSHKKAAFVCPVCSTRYISIIRNVIRYDGGCPKCAEGKRVASFARTQLAKKPSLIQFNPNLVSTEWDYNKNSEIGLYPDKIIYSSTKSAYWICEKGHSYLGRIDHRTIDKSGCPYCSNQKALAGYNDLQTQRPDLAKQWHPTKNTPLKPCDVVPFSNKKVWWLCELGHEWATSISHRAHGTNCPHCYSENGTSFPEQAIIFYLSKHIECINRHCIDGMEIDIYIPSQKIGFEYDGEIWHSSSKAKARESLKNEQFARMGITLYRIKEADSFFDMHPKS